MDARADAEFTEFMLGCWQRLVRLGYALTGDQGLAEDLAQTALTRAYGAGGTRRLQAVWRSRLPSRSRCW